MADEKPNALQFVSMRIDRESYGVNKGKLKANVRCQRYNTQLEVTLPDDVVNDMMKLIAPVIAAQVQVALIDVQRDHELIALTQGEVVEAE